MKKLKSLAQIGLSVSLAALVLSSCGGPQKSGVFKKQRGKSNISIQQLNISTGEIKALFQFRSIKEKQLSSVDCDLKLNDLDSINLNFNEPIELGPFAKETIVFSSTQVSKSLHVYVGDPQIKYQWNCEVQYTKNKERLNYKSVLFKVPGSDMEYR